jgi:hypothetical protein
MSSHYDPNQRRIPAGQEGAGRWTDGEAASTSILNSPLLDRDRLIRAALGIREDQKRDGNVQLAFDSQTSTEPLQLPSTRVQPNRPAPLGRGAGGLLGLLFSLLSELNSDDQRTIVIFRRGKFHDESDDGFSGLEFLRTPEEIEKYCGKDFKKVQDIVDHAYDEVKSRGLPLTPQNLGMAVHKRAEDDVEKIRGFTVELTYEKIPPGSDRVEVYGTKGSIRLDVSYRVKIDKKEGKEALCVAEIKTGREVLSYNRMLDIVSRAAVRDREKEEIDQILVTEMRPKNAPAGRRLRERK